MTPKQAKVAPVPQKFADPGLEARVLAALAAAGPDRFFELSGALSGELFTSRRAAYEALAGAFSRGEPAPPVLAGVSLPPEFDLEKAVEDLTELAANRLLAGAVSRIEAQIGKKPAWEVAAAMEEEGARASEAARPNKKSSFVLASDPELISRTLKWVEDAIAARKERGWAVINPPTGIPRLDRMLSGFSPGLWALLGTPGTGKTFFALHLALQFLRDPGAAVLYVSYEEPVMRLLIKAWSNYAGLRWDSYNSTLEDTEPLKQARAGFASMASRLALVEGDNILNMASLRRQARELKCLTKCTRLMVVLDYLQIAANVLAAPGKNGYQDDVRGRVGMVVSGLRKMANRMDAVVLAISALNRGSYKDAQSLSAGRESSDIEYSADVLLRLHAQEQGCPSQDRRRLELHVLKNRITGETGMVPLVAVLSQSKFGEVREDFDEEEEHMPF